MKRLLVIGLLLVATVGWAEEKESTNFKELEVKFMGREDDLKGEINPQVVTNDPVPLEKGVTTTWIGCPAVSSGNKYDGSIGWLPTIEIGLRSDGIVVWREREVK